MLARTAQNATTPHASILSNTLPGGRPALLVQPKEGNASRKTSAHATVMMFAPSFMQSLLSSEKSSALYCPHYPHCRLVIRAAALRMGERAGLVSRPTKALGQQVVRVLHCSQYANDFRQHEPFAQLRLSRPQRPPQSRRRADFSRQAPGQGKRKKAQALRYKSSGRPVITLCHRPSTITHNALSSMCPAWEALPK